MSEIENMREKENGSFTFYSVIPYSTVNYLCIYILFTFVFNIASIVHKLNPYIFFKKLQLFFNKRNCNICFHIKREKL